MNTLTKALNEVKPWSAKSSTLPVLGNVKLEATNGILELTTTNLEAMATTTILYEGKPFSTTTNLKRLMAVTKGMSDPITFELETKQVKNWKGEESIVDTLVVADKDTKVALNTIPVSEFPLTPPKGQHLGELNLTDIDRIWPFAASEEDRRPILGCVLFELGENEARFVATDGYGLAALTQGFQTDTPTSLLIPVNSLAKLKRKDINTAISATNGEPTNYVRFRMNNFSLIITLLEGKYPDYRQIIPTHHDCSIMVNVKEWLAALKSVSMFAKETNGITLHTVLDNMTVAARDEDGNRIKRAMPAERDGIIPPFALGLEHIETTLKACRNPTVMVKLQKLGVDGDGQPLPTSTPLVFEDNTNWQAVVMPMHVDKWTKEAKP